MLGLQDGWGGRAVGRGQERPGFCKVPGSGDKRTEWGTGVAQSCRAGVTALFPVDKERGQERGAMGLCFGWLHPSYQGGGTLTPNSGDFLSSRRSPPATHLARQPLGCIWHFSKSPRKQGLQPEYWYVCTLRRAPCSNAVLKFQVILSFNLCLVSGTVALTVPPTVVRSLCPSYPIVVWEALRAESGEP